MGVVDLPIDEISSESLSLPETDLCLMESPAGVSQVLLSAHAGFEELDGALLKLVALASVSGEPLTVDLAERAIRDLIEHTLPVLHLSNIEAIASVLARKGLPSDRARGVTCPGSTS